MSVLFFYRCRVLPILFRSLRNQLIFLMFIVFFFVVVDVVALDTSTRVC